MSKRLNDKEASILQIGLTVCLGATLSLAAGCAAGNGAAGGPPGAPPGQPGMAAMGGPPGAPPVSAPVAVHPVAPSPSSETHPAVAGGTPAGLPQAPKTDPPPGAPGSPDAKGKDGLPEGVNPLSPTNKVEQAGNPVNLASEIIAAGTNPFMDKLPKPVLPPSDESKISGGGEVAPPEVHDPFEGVSLLGIVYNKKSPMVLLSISGGENQSQLARKGDILQMAGAQIKVTGIGKDNVQLQLLGPGKETTALTLPSLIGYGSTPSDGSSGTTPSSSADNPKSSAPVNVPGLNNLKKLSQGASSQGAAPAPASSGADVELKEP